MSNQSRADVASDHNHVITADQIEKRRWGCGRRVLVSSAQREGSRQRIGFSPGPSALLRPWSCERLVVKREEDY